MQTQELADLIFPMAKEISFYEEKYKKRELKERCSCNALCTKSNRLYAYWRIISSFGGSKNG